MTISDEEKGFKVCECGDGVLLFQSGYDVRMHMCSCCKCMVADKEDFFSDAGVEILSK